MWGLECFFIFKIDCFLNFIVNGYWFSWGVLMIFVVFIWFIVWIFDNEIFFLECVDVFDKEFVDDDVVCLLGKGFEWFVLC